MAQGTAHLEMSGMNTSDDLRSLARWLLNEDELRGRVEFPDSGLGEGQMGGALEVVTVVVTSGTAATFVKALFYWLRARASATKVTVKLHTKRGVEFVVECGSADDSVKVLREIHELLASDEDQ
jgi:hypothetical protein